MNGFATSGYRRFHLTTALCAGVLCLLPLAGISQEVDETEQQEETAQPENAARQGESLQLEEITLTAAPGTTTEGTNSWTTEWMRSATGLVLSQKETPQSTSVITDAQMKDRNITTVAETMDAATGITVQAYESDRINYYSRGFFVDSYQYDGVPVPRDGTWQFGDNNADMALYDHVEIVRGATGLMQGAGEPGASINFIRKRPTEEYQNQAAIALAYPQGGRIESDISGPLNGTGTVRGRLVSVVDGRDGMLDGYHKDKYVLFGALDADLGADTVLSAGISYQKTEADNVTWGGLPPFYADGGLIDWPWGSNLGADWTYIDTEHTEAFASLEHVFQNGWTGRLVLTHMRNDFDSKLAWISGVPERDTGLGMSSWAANYDGGYKQNSINAVLNGDFQAMGREHQFVVGAMASDLKGAFYGYDVDDSTLAPVGDVFDWDGSFPEPSFASDPSIVWRNKARQYAIYGTVQFHASDALAVLGGARVNWWKGEETETGSPAFAYDYNGEVTPYLGFTYDINPTYTAYGSITSIYKPQLVQDEAGNYLKPTYGWNYELGVKGDLMGGALYASAAIFQTNQNDVADYVRWDEDLQRSIYRSIAGTKTRGFELEAAGAITDRWNVSAGYTFRISEDRDGNELYTDQPRHTLKLATDYRPAGIMGDKLTVGGAMRWQSGTDSMDFDSDIEQPNVHQGAYAVFDLNASYDLSDTAELTLSVNNIFNKKYYATTGFYDTVVYGDERSAELMLRTKF